MNEDASGRGEARGKWVEAHEDVSRWNRVLDKTDGDKHTCAQRWLDGPR